MFCFSLWDWEENVLHERTLQSTQLFWVLKGKSQLNLGFLSFTNWMHPWTSKEHRNGFLWDQSRSAFLNSQFLLYALMSFMRSCLWFKFFHQRSHGYLNNIVDWIEEVAWLKFVLSMANLMAKNLWWKCNREKVTFGGYIT